MHITETYTKKTTAEQLRMNASLSSITHAENTSLSSSNHAENMFLSSSTDAANQGE